MLYRLVAVLAAFLLLCSCGDTSPPDTAPEWRGVWLSYLELRPMLADADPTTAMARLDRVMDTCAAYGVNTVLFHARSHGDAYYASATYPAAEATAHLLRQGFDPLNYAVQAAHSRGLALHAWVNPYRLSLQETGGFVKEGARYADPADPTARQRVLDGVEELLTRYEVDGIHFDDYFYPVGMAVEGEPFENIPADTDVTAWRQAQVDALVSGVYRLCHRYERAFGISPAADIRKTATQGYADVTRWMEQTGYIDYICPQLYTGFEHETHPFPRLLEEWGSLPRQAGVALYIGLPLYKAGLDNDPYAGSGSDEWTRRSDILARQVTALREVADGFALFRYEHLTHPDAKDEMNNLTELLR